MGKMGEAANLGMVAIAAYVVYRLAGLKLPSFEMPKLPGFEWPAFEWPDGRDPDYYRRRKEEILGDTDLGPREHSDLWDIEFTPVSALEDKLAVFTEKSVHFREVLVSHEARAAAHEEYFEAAIPDVTSRIETLQTSMAELSAMVPRPSADLDAGGSTDMDPAPIVWGARRAVMR